MKTGLIVKNIYKVFWKYGRLFKGKFIYPLTREGRWYGHRTTWWNHKSKVHNIRYTGRFENPHTLQWAFKMKGRKAQQGK